MTTAHSGHQSEILGVRQIASRRDVTLTWLFPVSNVALSIFVHVPLELGAPYNTDPILHPSISESR
jgi:hypothetical protein